LSSDIKYIIVITVIVLVTTAAAVIVIIIIIIIVSCTMLAELNLRCWQLLDRSSQGYEHRDKLGK